MVISCRARRRALAFRSKNMLIRPSARPPCLLSAMVAPFSCSLTLLIFNGRAGNRKRSWRVWQPFYPRTSGYTFHRFPISPLWERPSSFKVERSITWLRLRLRWILSSPVSKARGLLLTSLSMNIAVRVGRSAPPSKPCVSGNADGKRPLSA